MTLTYITIRGTGEPLNGPGNMLNRPAAKVSGIQHVDLAYPASIACFNPEGSVTGVSEAQSRATGVANLAAAIRATPHRVVLSGYSLGGLVVSDFLAAKAQGQYSDCHVDAVVNIANPARRAGQSFGLPSFGFGLDGQHAAWPANIDVYEIANPVDGITSAPADSPWRHFAHDIRRFNVSFQGVANFVNDMNARLWQDQAARMPANLFNPRFYQSYAEAPAWLRGYLYDGQHGAAYFEKRWFDELGRAISGVDLAARAVQKYV